MLKRSLTILVTVFIVQFLFTACEKEGDFAPFFCGEADKIKVGELQATYDFGFKQIGVFVSGDVVYNDNLFNNTFRLADLGFNELNATCPGPPPPIYLDTLKSLDIYELREDLETNINDELVVGENGDFEGAYPIDERLFNDFFENRDPYYGLDFYIHQKGGEVIDTSRVLKIVVELTDGRELETIL